MAYGLYSHIQSNRRRSVVLLIGLFFLVYVLTFAGALVAEVVFGGDARLDFLINAALRRTISVDPEDITANYLLVRAYNGLRSQARMERRKLDTAPGSAQDKQLV